MPTYVFSLHNVLIFLTGNRGESVNILFYYIGWWLCLIGLMELRFVSNTRSQSKNRAKIEHLQILQHQDYLRRQFYTLRWHNLWPKFRRKLGHGAKTGQNRAATKFGTSRLYESPVCRLCHLKVVRLIIRDFTKFRGGQKNRPSLMV